MRPIVSEQDFLRYPLNELLGTRAHVRLLRVMANEVDGPLTVSDAARLSGLTLPGAKKALEKLLQTGFITLVGGGSRHQYQLRFPDRLVQAVLVLFKSESDRYERLFDSLKKAIRLLVPHPHAVWVQVYPKYVGDVLVLGLLHETRHLTDCVQDLRDRLNQTESEFDLTIELEGYTKADLFDHKMEDAMVLYGVLPAPQSSASSKHKVPRTHREKDQYLALISLKLAKAVELDSSLRLRAKAHIDRLLKHNPGNATRDLREWRDILALYSPRRLSRFLTSETERAKRLRQSNPFYAVLNADERARLIHNREGL